MSGMAELAAQDEQDKQINFCLHKCGEGGYCPAMKGQGGFPCLEFICTFCHKVDILSGYVKAKYCKVCRGEWNAR
jgi:hypothetical protein